MKPICLPTSDDTPYDMVVTGFGLTENGTQSEELLSAELAYCPTTPCKELNPGFIFTDNQFCAVGKGMNKTDSCKGDSGKNPGILCI